MVLYIHEVHISENSTVSEVRPVGFLGHMPFNTFLLTSTRVILILEVATLALPMTVRGVFMSPPVNTVITVHVFVHICHGQ